MTPVATASPYDIVAGYAARNFALVLWPRLPDPKNTWKGPREDGWPSKVYDPRDYREDMQIGTKTGTEISPGRFLLDVDLDWTPGTHFVGRFLPRTDFGFGRASRPVGHAFYTTSTPIRHTDFKDGDITLVELRGTKADGSIGKQTMLPPSIHRESGEVVTLKADGDITHNDDVPHLVALYAVACLLGRHWPKNGPTTNQHDTAAYAAGFLCQRGVDPDRVPVIVEVAATLGGDDNTEDRVRFARDTVLKFQSGEKKLAGGRKLAGEIGKPAVATLEQWLPKETADNDSGIVVRGGDLSSIVDRAETALLATPIYQRGGLLTRAIKLDTAIGEQNSVRREAGSTVLIAVREPWLVEQMGLTSKWIKMVKVTGKEKTKGSDDEYKPTPIDPPPLYARTLIGRNEWRFPVLRGVVTSPTLARDGRIIETPGFDAASGLLLDIAPNTFPSVPQNPTQDDAIAALALFAAPLRGFPFVDDAAESVALSALLSALVRVSLRSAPLHGYDAPAAGTGKSLLAEMAGLLATGFRPPALSQGKSDEEDEKRLSTVLFAGDPVIHIDNCERPISGDFLCSMLTQEVVQARILGLSERRVLPSTALVLASGNNLTLAGDTSRRAVMCRLDAKVERPDTRTFDFDCHAEVLAARPELVVAGLTILRAYHVAGRPAKLTPMGSFNDWEWVRGALVWLGRADPADTRSSILDSDPRKDELISVMEQWSQVFAAEHVTVGHIATRDKRQKPEDPATPADALRARLTEVACKGSWNAKSVGWWLRRNKDSVVGGRCFRCEPGEGRGWWLESQATKGETQLALATDGEVPF